MISCALLPAQTSKVDSQAPPEGVVADNGVDSFGQSIIQLGELDYLLSSRAGRVTIAENYVGLPLEDE